MLRILDSAARVTAASEKYFVAVLESIALTAGWY